MVLDKETTITLGVATVGVIAGWLFGRSLGRTINKMKLDTLKLENRILELELQNSLRTSKEEHAAQMEVWAKKIADTRAKVDDLTDQSAKALSDQAKWKEMFEKNELTPEQYFEKLSKYLP